jgi:small subunit ribosomal protein S8
MTDPITDMLNRIRNAQAVSHQTVDVPFSKLKAGIAKILEEEKFLTKVDIKRKKKGKILKLSLKYDKKEGVISGLKRISRPGQRIYSDFKGIYKIKKKSGIVILSTSKGLMIDKEARKKRLGGELLCEIW